MNFLDLAQSRYTSKAYDANKKIPEETLTQLLEILRLTPSSINIQPWQFIVAQSQGAKEKIAEAMPDTFAYNIPKVLNASEVIIFTVRSDIDQTHLDKILDAEDEAGRFRTPESKETQRTTRQGYINLYKQQNKINGWVENQTHIALGNALFAAKAANIDATPIGGFNHEILDRVFDFQAQGLRSVVLLALGYHSDADFNADLPKGRLKTEDVIKII